MTEISLNILDVAENSIRAEASLVEISVEVDVLAVASSSPMRHIDQALGELGLSDCFAVKVSGENVAHPKPAPDTFLIAAEKLGVLPKDCLVVEDSTNGGKAAAAAGMDCVWFHNPDSGVQSIPQAVLELTSWEGDAAGKVLELLQK